MILAFDPTRLPRSTTRQQWRKIDRWRRTTQRELAAAVRRDVENLAIYGTSEPELQRKAIDRLVNPPVLIWQADG